MFYVYYHDSWMGDRFDGAYETLDEARHWLLRVRSVCKYAYIKDEYGNIVEKARD